MFYARQFFGIFVLHIFVLLRAEIQNVQKENFEELTTGKKFILLYVVSGAGDCEKCNLLFPAFLATSNLFSGNPEIFFGRVFDQKLVEVLEVKEFPAVVYYEHGSASHEQLYGDISIDNMVATIKQGMTGDYSHVTPRYTVELSGVMYEECVAIQDQYTFVIMYDSDSSTSASKEIQIFEDLAASFKNDEGILFAGINASKETKLAGDFAVTRYPAFYWYDRSDKSVRKRYGGRMDPDELITFVNDQTHLDRKFGGELLETAGRLPELDTLVAMYMEDIVEGTHLEDAVRDAEKYAQNAQFNKEYAQYYVKILKMIRDSGKVDAIDEERDLLMKQLTRGNLTPKQGDDVTKRRNVIHKFVDDMAMMLIGGDHSSIKVVKTDQKFKDKTFSIQDLHEEL